MALTSLFVRFTIREGGLPCKLSKLSAHLLPWFWEHCARTSAQTMKGPEDPGVRGGAAGAGAPLQGLTADETAFFRDGLARFADIEVVTGGNNNGLGPRFNSNQCLSCHAQPAAGGSSPARNPLIGIAHLNGARNVVPWFIAQNGPIRESRFKLNPNGTNDGGVHNLFVITGRSDSAGCNIAQESRSNHKQFLVRRIAWRLQANAEGDLSERAKQRAVALAEQADLRIRAPQSFLKKFSEGNGFKDARAPATGTWLTQPLNTTSSLGRLTLNILLSFAEFERQLIRDRTRDKMAAARRRGKWVRS